MPPPDPGPPLLEVRALSRTYEGGTRALHDVSLSVWPGEFIALIGQNGSGKTTLAKHLNGLLQAEAGEVRLAGTDLRTLPLERVAREVGYVFQNPDHQLFAATVAEEVAFGPRNFGFEGDALATRVDETLAAVGLGDVRDEDPFLLRKGDRQRLAVATVLAMAPRVLILDEPTTGLDYPQQRRMLELLARLRAAGTTVIVITHSPWVVVEFAERALLMREGRLVFDGPLDTLLGDEALLRSAAFEAPPAARVAYALGIPARTVDELARALGAERLRMALSLYLESASWLHRRHPMAKVLALVMLFVAAFLLDDPALLAPLLALVLVLTVTRGVVAGAASHALVDDSGFRLHHDHLDGLLSRAGGGPRRSLGRVPLRARHGRYGSRPFSPPAFSSSPPPPSRSSPMRSRVSACPIGWASC